MAEGVIENTRGAQEAQRACACPEGWVPVSVQRARLFGGRLNGEGGTFTLILIAPIQKLLELGSGAGRQTPALDIGLQRWTSDSDTALGCAPLLPSAGNLPLSTAPPSRCSPSRNSPETGLASLATLSPSLYPKMSTLRCEGSRSPMAAGHLRSCRASL